MSESFDARWQEVCCRRCKKRYQCTPESDYYNATTADDGLCFGCLLIEGGLDPDATAVRVTDLSGNDQDPRNLALRGDAA